MSNNILIKKATERINKLIITPKVDRVFMFVALVKLGDLVRD